jgi:hypothetical protein
VIIIKNNILKIEITFSFEGYLSRDVDPNTPTCNVGAAMMMAAIMTVEMMVAKIMVVMTIKVLMMAPSTMVMATVFSPRPGSLDR